jgi:hypothetical protein
MARVCPAAARRNPPKARGRRPPGRVAHALLSHGSTMLAAFADGPVLLSRKDPNAATQILSVAFATSTVRSDRVVAACLRCTGAQRHRVTVEALTPGFAVDLLPERAHDDDRILLAIRVHRRLGTVRRLCLVRFSVGEAAAVATITVLA